MSRSGAHGLLKAGRLAAGAAVAIALMALAACSSNNQQKPAPLAKLVNRVHITRLWRVHLRGQAPKRRLGLGLAVADGRVFAASHDGVVEAFALSDGRRLWRTRVRAPLSGGPGVGAGLVVLGSSKGDVIALSEADGKVRWRTLLDTEILAAPAVGDDVVVVRGVDGRLEALATATGADRWIVDESVPRLSLRGTSRPILLGNLAICGFDDGHVLAVNRSNGMTEWNAVVDQPHGSSELQRLIDVDGPVVAAGADLYAVAYQGRVVRLSRDSGRSIWTRELSSYRGLTVAGDAVYVSTADGTLERLDRSSGAVQWQQKVLTRREVSAPAFYAGNVVVGDLDGYLHWFDPAHGTYVARVRAGRGRISFGPVVYDGRLLVFTDDGYLSVWRAPNAVAAPASAAPASAATVGAPAQVSAVSARTPASLAAANR